MHGPLAGGKLKNLPSVIRHKLVENQKKLSSVMLLSVYNEAKKAVIL